MWGALKACQWKTQADGGRALNLDEAKKVAGATLAPKEFRLIVRFDHRPAVFPAVVLRLQHAGG